MSEKEEIDHDCTGAPVCPYCGFRDANCDEWDDIEDEEEGEVECIECGCLFTWQKSVSVTFSTQKVKEK